MNKKKTVCMIVQDKMVKGGIAAVISGYYNSILEDKYNLIYIESYKDGNKLTKLFQAFKGYFLFLKVLFSNKPDLIHIHSSFGPSFYRKLIYIYISFWAKIPIINHIHGADFDTFFLQAGKWKKSLIRNTYGHCSVLIALSEEWKLKLSQIVPKEKITVIKNYSILHDDVIAERKARKCNNTVLFLGELGKRKGCYDIPAVVEKVIDKIPEAKFVLAGAGSEEDEEAIISIAKEIEVESCIEFPGWIRDEKKNMALRDADVFFLPSYNEGMPMSILDAMGYGLPVVSTFVGGIPELIQNGVNGFVFNPGDTIGMAEGIISILQNTKKRNLMIDANSQIVQNQFSLEKHLEALDQLYKKEIG